MRMKLMQYNAPKGQQALSPGHRPGYRDAQKHTPCKGKSFDARIMLLPLQGATPGANLPRALPWAECGLPFQGV